MKKLIITNLILALGFISSGFAQDLSSIDGKSLFGDIKARHIGPALMSGRINDMEVHPTNSRIIYAGTAGGGVWKSNDAGTSFNPIFDDYCQSIGAVTLDPNDPDNTIYVGTGETWTRNSVSVGDGLYKSTDGGANWKKLGFDKSERIANIIVNPNNSNEIYVGVLGALWGDSEERGVFKSTDAGATWNKLLYVDQKTGCADLAMDPSDPNTLYASMWEFRRTGWSFDSGGDKSALYKSTDAGKTWNKIHTGFPEGKLGRLGIAIAKSNPKVLYTVIEAEKKERKGLYRSDDAGASWEQLNNDFGITVRPFYFSRIVVDPRDENVVVKGGLSGSISRDGGVYRSWDGGTNMEIVENLPLSQFYHISLDDAEPYNVYGGLQDNGSWWGPSSSPGGVEARDWNSVGYGDGFRVLKHPTKPIIYSEMQGAENVWRVDTERQLSKTIQPLQASKDKELRWNWNAPMAVSTHQPDRTIFTIAESPLDEKVIWVGTDDGNVQVTQDGGKSWTNTVANISGLPKNTWCYHIEASTFDKGTAYAVFDGHTMNDMNPYAYKTTDYGKTWTSIISDDVVGFARNIQEDYENQNLLFLGTEFGLYITMDGGKNWKKFTNNMPSVAVHFIDLHKRTNDLVMGTHGRGVIIIDDISPLRAISNDVLAKNVHFFETPATTINETSSFSGGFGNETQFIGANKTKDVQLKYYLKKRHTFGKMKMEIQDMKGNTIAELGPGKSKGINIVNWNYTRKQPKVAKGKTFSFGGFTSPIVPEGTYKAVLTKGKETFEHTFDLVYDKNSPLSETDRELKNNTTMQLYDMTQELAFLVYELDAMIVNAEAAKNMKMVDKLNALKETLVITTGDNYVGSAEQQLREKMADLYSKLASIRWLLCL